MMAKVDDDCSGSLSFPEFASMVSLCKEQGDDDDEEKRRLELLAEEERNRPPFHILRGALTIDPEKRPEKDIDTILQQVTAHFPEPDCNDTEMIQYVERCGNSSTSELLKTWMMKLPGGYAVKCGLRR